MKAWMAEFWWIPIVYILVINLVTFLMYGIDKRRAKKNKWRISEKALLIAAAIGGTVGALLGMKKLHHKTKKWKFKILVPLFLILQIALCIYLGFGV